MPRSTIRIPKSKKPIDAENMCPSAIQIIAPPININSIFIPYSDAVLTGTSVKTTETK